MSIGFGIAESAQSSLLQPAPALTLEVGYSLFDIGCSFPMSPVVWPRATSGSGGVHRQVDQLGMCPSADPLPSYHSGRRKNTPDECRWTVTGDDCGSRCRNATPQSSTLIVARNRRSVSFRSGSSPFLTTYRRSAAAITPSAGPVRWRSLSPGHLSCRGRISRRSIRVCGRLFTIFTAGKSPAHLAVMRFRPDLPLLAVRPVDGAHDNRRPHVA